MSAPTIPQRLRRARLLAMQRAPYLSHALIAIRPGGPVPHGTVAVDQWGRLYWCQAWIERQPLAVLAAAWVHEVSHLLRDHAGRRQGRAPGPWNLAADAEINDMPMLRAGGALPLPDWAVRPRTLGAPEGLTAERYYDHLERQRARARGGRGSKVNVGDQRPGEHEHGACAGDCGSIADGRPRPYEAPPPNQGGPEGLSPVEARAVRVETACAIKAAGQQAGDAWLDWADYVLGPPAVPWQRLLRTAIQRRVQAARGRADYTYAQPSRRQRPGVILPGMAAPAVSVALVIDTSASMGSADARRALSEAEGIVRAAGAPVRVIWCDTRAHDGGAHQSMRRAAREARGGGGTDMAAGIRAALEGRPRPACVVVLTDGWTPWPSRAPGVPVIVGVIGGDGAPEPPTWARTVRIPVEETRP